MRRLTDILRDCEARGVRLRTSGSELEVRGASTPELRADLKAHKSNVLHYLRTRRCHHELEPQRCAVCGGHVRKLIENTREEDR